MRSHRLKSSRAARGFTAAMSATVVAVVILASPPAAHAELCGVCPGVVTTYDPDVRGPAPPNTRLHQNLVPNLTYYLDVTGGEAISAIQTPASDVSVKIEVVDPKKPKLTVKKLSPGAQLPVRVEALVRASSSAPWTSGGYDGLTDARGELGSAPDSFVVALDLSDRDLDPATDQARVEADIAGAASSLVLVAEQFTGDPAGTRKNRTVRRLMLRSDDRWGARVPGKLVADLTRSAKTTQLTVTRDVTAFLEYDMTAPGNDHVRGRVVPLTNNVNLKISSDASVAKPDGTTEIVDKKLDYKADGSAFVSFSSTRTDERTWVEAAYLPREAAVTYTTDDTDTPKISYHADSGVRGVNVGHEVTRVVNGVSQELTLTGRIVDLPANIDELTFKRRSDGATASYKADGGIGRIELQASLTGGTFFGRVKRIEAAISGLPPSNTLNFTRANGGFVATATNPIGTASLLASDGADAPPIEGAYAWFEDTPSIWRAFVRIDGLKGVTFKADPVAGSIDTAAPQVFKLHGQVGGVTLDGVIDKLPAHVDFVAPSDRVQIRYTGLPIDHVNLTAKGLPAAAKFRNAKVDVYGISPVLDVYLGIDPANRPGDPGALEDDCPPEGCEPPCDPRTEECEPDPEPDPDPRPTPAPELYGIDAHGQGIGRIALHAWADDADLPSHPDLPATGNEIRYDAKVAGHDDLRANIVNLKQALYTKNAASTRDYPFTEDGVLVEFTQAAPITLGIKKEALNATVKIPQVPGRPLPTKYGLRLEAGKTVKAVFTPNATIPLVEVEVAAGKDREGERLALVKGQIQNIPRHTTVCFSQGWFGCDDWLRRAPGGQTSQQISNEIDVKLATDGPPVSDANAMRMDARICLGEIGSNAWVPSACENNQVAKNYVDIVNLRVRNFDLEYTGHGVAHKYQGDHWGDDALAAHLHTDGVLVDSLRYVKDDGKGVEFIKKNAPLTAQDFFAAVNYSATARVGFKYGPIGTLSCPPATELYLLERESATGKVSRYDIPEVIDLDGDNNLWDYIESKIDC